MPRGWEARDPREKGAAMHVWQWVAIVERGLICIGVILGAVAVRQNAQAEARTQHILGE
jgi:hypothetical protein